MANFSTSTLQLIRKDWAKADTIAGEVDLNVWNWLRNLDPSQRDVYVKGNTGLGMATKVTEGSPTPVHTPAGLPQLTLSQSQRSAKIIFTLEAQEFDLYGKIPELGAEAKTSIDRRKAQDVANLLLNNGFSSSYPTATGDELYSDSHTINGLNFDNLATSSALSESNLETMITMALNQKDAKNQPMSFKGPWYLYLGPTLALTAEKILGTSQVVGSADNDINVARRYIELMVDPFITSTTAYALLPKMASKAEAYKIVKVDNKNIVDEDSDGNLSMKKYSIYEMGVWMPYNFVGNAGA